MNADPLSTLADTEGLPPTADIDEADKVPVLLDEAGEEILPEEDGEEGDELMPPPWEAGEEAEPEAQEDDEPPPAKPTRAMSAWGLFLKKNFNGAISAKASEEWKALDEEARVEYTEAAAVEKARYEEQKASYKPLFDAWAETHPVAAANIAFQTKASADLALDKKIAYLPLAKVRKQVKLAMKSGGTAKAVSREGLFTLVKSAEQLVAMLGEQTANTARKSRRKAVGPQDLSSVLYGPRYADIMDFCHYDVTHAKLAALAEKPTKAKKLSEPKTSKKKRKKVSGGEGGEGGGEAAEGMEEDEDDVEDDDEENANVQKKGKGKDMPVQSTTMLNFFAARPVGEPAPAPPPGVSRLKKRVREEEEEEEELLMVQSSDEEEEADDDDEDEEEDDDEEEEEMAMPAARTNKAGKRNNVLDDDDEDE